MHRLCYAEYLMLMLELCKPACIAHAWAVTLGLSVCLHSYDIRGRAKMRSIGMST